MVGLAVRAPVREADRDLDVARATRADFERLSTFVVLDEAPGTRRIAQSLRVRGVGEAAFAQRFAGVDLEVWYHGLVISVSTTFVGAPLAAEKQLAAAAIARIDRAEARGLERDGRRGPPT